MCRPVWNQLFSRKSCLPNALSTEYCKAGAQEALHCKANTKVHVRHTQRHSKQREAQDRSWESACRDVPDHPLPQLLSPVSGTDLHAFTSLPATLAPWQASDNSRRAEADTEQPMKDVSHHDCAGKFKVGMQTFPDPTCRMRALSSLFMPLNCYIS